MGSVEVAWAGVILGSRVTSDSDHYSIEWRYSITTSVGSRTIFDFTFRLVVKVESEQYGRW